MVCRYRDPTDSWGASRRYWLTVQGPKAARLPSQRRSTPFHSLTQPGSSNTCTRVLSTTPSTTVVEDSRLCAAPRISTLRARHAVSDSKQLTAGMTATLTAELEGRVPDELVAEIVRAVLDETRRATKDRVVEFTMYEARLRLERFIRARAAS